ncbi:MAG: O-antigen ligase family protein [Betaproteobacteria bacterium]|nr:O-antigen ligase family protein [Betaproteobacteria bacterium]
MLLLALLLAAARATDNRMVWIALAAVFATASLLGALRWRASLRRAPLRWLVPLLCLLVALGALFADAVREKAQQHHPPQTSVAQALATDPRIVLWDHTVERIRERPWTGFGFGRGIIGDELRAALRDPLLAHAHNVFVSQWLQTGAPGFALLVALLAALATAHAASLRSADPTRALLGVIGLSLLAGFVVKNLTDDFFFGSNAREFWALNAILLGYDARLRAAMAAARSPG